MRVLHCVAAAPFICFTALPLHAPAQDSPGRLTILFDTGANFDSLCRTPMHLESGDSRTW
jgi:hypothetical protein